MTSHFRRSAAFMASQAARFTAPWPRTPMVKRSTEALLQAATIAASTQRAAGSRLVWPVEDSHLWLDAPFMWAVEDYL